MQLADAADSKSALDPRKRCGFDPHPEHRLSRAKSSGAGDYATGTLARLKSESSTSILCGGEESKCAMTT